MCPIASSGGKSADREIRRYLVSRAETRTLARDSREPASDLFAMRDPELLRTLPGLALMEGGDLLGAYERACELAEQEARLAGVIEALSAFHKERAEGTLQESPGNEMASLAANSSTD